MEKTEPQLSVKVNVTARRLSDYYALQYSTCRVQTLKEATAADIGSLSLALTRPYEIFLLSPVMSLLFLCCPVEQANSQPRPGGLGSGVWGRTIIER